MPIAAVLCILAAIGAAGCGGSSEPAPTPSPTPIPTPSPTPVRAARLWVLASLDDPGQSRRPPSVLLFSDDLGASWQSLADSGLAGTATAIDFVDSERGVAVSDSRVQRTGDAGSTWTTQLDDPRQPPDPYLVLAGVQLDDAGTAAVLGSVVDDNYLNAQGYEAWRLPADGAAPERGSVASGGVAVLSSMCLTANGVGVAVGSFRFSTALLAYATTFGTLDGGASWQLLENITRGGTTWYGTACAGERDLWRFGVSSVGGPFEPNPGPDATVVHSVDGGATWDGPVDRAALAGAFIAAASFVDRSTGWLLGSFGVLRTDDAGATLVPQTMPDEARGDLTTIAFVNDRVGLVAGSCGGAGPPCGSTEATSDHATALVLVTSDGGTTWSVASLPSGLSSVLDVDATP